MICTAEHVINWVITHGTLACHGHVMHTSCMMSCTTSTSNSCKGGHLSLIPIIIISLHSLCNLLDVSSLLLRCIGSFKWVRVFHGSEAMVGFLECSGIGARKFSLGLEDHCAQRHCDDVWYSTLVVSLMIVWSTVLLPLHHSLSNLFSFDFFAHVHPH